MVSLLFSRLFLIRFAAGIQKRSQMICINILFLVNEILVQFILSVGRKMRYALKWEATFSSSEYCIVNGCNLSFRLIENADTE